MAHFVLHSLTGGAAGRPSSEQLRRGSQSWTDGDVEARGGEGRDAGGAGSSLIQPAPANLERLSSTAVQTVSGCGIRGRAGRQAVAVNESVTSAPAPSRSLYFQPSHDSPSVRSSD